MDKFIIGIIFIAFLLWLPLFIAAIYGWFAPISFGYKIGYTILVCAIWMPIITICAWMNMNE